MSVCAVGAKLATIKGREKTNKRGGALALSQEDLGMRLGNLKESLLLPKVKEMHQRLTNLPHALSLKQPGGPKRNCRPEGNRDYTGVLDAGLMVGQLWVLALLLGLVGTSSLKGWILSSARQS